MKKQIEYATSILFALLLIRSTAVRSLLTLRSAPKYATAHPTHTQTHTYVQHMQHINSYWAPPAKCAQCSSSNLLQFKQLTCSFCRCILRQQEVQNMKQPRQKRGAGREGGHTTQVRGAGTGSSCCNCRKRNHKPTPKHVNNSGSPQVQSAPATRQPPHPLSTLISSCCLLFSRRNFLQLLQVKLKFARSLLPLRARIH